MATGSQFHKLATAAESAATGAQLDIKSDNNALEAAVTQVIII